MKRLGLIAILLLFFGLTSCVPPYRQTFDDAGKEKGWTQKQTNAAFAYADRIFWSRQAGDNKYVIVYSKIPVSKVREQLEGVLKDLDDGLDPKNTENQQYLNTFHLRKDMEHDEEITQAIYDRVRASELQTQFNQKMGDTPEYGDEAELAQGYNIRKIYINKPMDEAFPFTADVIESAKKAGTLKSISHVVLTINNTLDHKASDPTQPNDANEFVWKAKQESIDLTEYKIIDVEKPLDNQGSYIEGYRVIDGKKESKPALKVFFPPDGAIALVDTDEEGTPGFGIPNVIEDLESNITATDIARDGSLLDQLFTKNEQKKERVVPEAKLFQVEIAPLDKPIDEWQKSLDKEGWIVPFKYKNMLGDNYNVRIKFKKPDVMDSSHEHSMFMNIEYIEKEYTKTGDQFTPSAGQVIEYYRPKLEFAGKIKAKVLYLDDTKKVQFEFSDGSIVEGFITSTSNKFIEDLPYAKSYTEGQRRWWIESRTAPCVHTSCVYDSRKIVGPPKERTGDYNDSSAVITAEPQDDMNMMMGATKDRKLQTPHQQ